VIKTNVLPPMLLLCLGITWSLGYVIVRYCTTHGVQPLGYAFWQSVGPAILLTGTCFILKQRIPTSRPYLFFYLSAALIGIALPNANMYFSSQHLPAGILAVVINTVPIMTYLFALLFREERFDIKRFIGVLFAFGGLLILSRPDHALTDYTTHWIAIALLSPIGFSLCAVYVSKRSPEKDYTTTIAAGMLCAASCWLIPVVLLSGQFHAFSWPLHTVDKLLLIEILLSSLGYFLFFQLLKRAGAVYYSLVGGIVSLIGLFWGWLFFHERLNPHEGIAVTLIIVGVLIVSLVKRIR
jgi:drug/metabolite transporter (DMT)-like permease